MTGFANSSTYAVPGFGVGFVAARLSGAVALGLLLIGSAFGAEDPAEFIKVKIGDEYKLATPPLADLEAGKTLDVQVQGTLTVGVVAIGGETTGAVIKVGKTTWELDLPTDPKILAMAKELNGKSVLVSGKVSRKAGVEIKFRTILKVENLKAAGK